MEDILKPANEPYSEGDTVRIYLTEDDLDSRFNEKICTITEVRHDEFGDIAERELDKYESRLADDNGELDLRFRHFDLVCSASQ